MIPNTAKVFTERIRDNYSDCPVWGCGLSHCRMIKRKAGVLGATEQPRVRLGTTFSVAQTFRTVRLP